MKKMLGREVLAIRNMKKFEEEDECESDDDSSALRPASPGCSPRSLTPPPSEAGEHNKKSWWKFGSGRKEKEGGEAFVEEVKLNEAEKLIEEIPPDERLPYRLDYQVQPQLMQRIAAIARY